MLATTISCQLERFPRAWADEFPVVPTRRHRPTTFAMVLEVAAVLVLTQYYDRSYLGGGAYVGARALRVVVELRVIGQESDRVHRG